MAKAAAEEELERRAALLCEHDPSLNHAAAVKRLLESEPELYAATQRLSRAGGRGRDGQDVGERVPARVSKSEPVQLSKAAEDFLADFTQWLSEGGRSSFTKADDGDPLERWLEEL